MKKIAMSTIAIKSSKIARASRKMRACLGSPLPKIASTPSANAMSVAVGIGQPLIPSVPVFSRAKMTAGAITPPRAATIGTKAVDGFESTPLRNSYFSSRPATRKKVARSKSLTQCSMLRFRPSDAIPKSRFLKLRSCSPNGEFASTRPAIAAAIRTSAAERSLFIGPPSFYKPVTKLRTKSKLRLVRMC